MPEFYCHARITIQTPPYERKRKKTLKIIQTRLFFFLWFVSKPFTFSRFQTRWRRSVETSSQLQHCLVHRVWSTVEYSTEQCSLFLFLLNILFVSQPHSNEVCSLLFCSVTKLLIGGGRRSAFSFSLRIAKLIYEPCGFPHFLKCRI